MKEQIIGVIIGFITFFLFPIAEFIGKRYFSRNDGNPELWYVPKYCFRLVVRNIPSKAKLYDLKYKSRVREIIPASNGCSVETFIDETLIDSGDFFLMPGDDQIILSFKLDTIDGIDYFIQTDKVGIESKRIELNKIDYLISDYTAQIDNKFQFDLFIGRRVEIKKKTLEDMLVKVKSNPLEQSFGVDKIIQIG